MAENELKITDTFIEWKNKFNKSLNDVSVYGLRVEALDTLQTQHYNELKSADSDLTAKYNELNTKQEDLTAKYNNLNANVDSKVDSKYKKAINACIAYALILGDNSALKLPADFDLVQAYNYVNSLNNSDSSSGSGSGTGGSGSGTGGTGSGTGTESGGSGSGTGGTGSGTGTESGGTGSDYPLPIDPPTPPEPPVIP